MADQLQFTQDGAVARLVINRPDEGNVISLAMLREMTGLITDAGNDPDTKLILLSGKGDDFSRGRDPKGAPEKGPVTARDIKGTLMDTILGFYAAVRDAEIPVLAAVKGTTNGMACATASICDVTIAADDARFSLPEMKGGIAPTLAIYAHIDRIPAKALLWLVYSTEQITADAALGYGLVSRVLPSADFAQGVEAFVKTMSGYERSDIAACKQYLWRARQMEPRAASDLAGNMLAVLLSSK